MILRDVLNLISNNDKVSIHSDDGQVLFDDFVYNLGETINQDCLNKPISRIRAYKDIIIILL